MPSEPDKKEVGREYPPADEAAVIEEVIKFQSERMHAAGPGKRAQHPKGIGCVRAEFTVLPNLPATLAHGVFREARTFPAWIRFSNGFGEDDRLPDFRGMAIKLMGVEGDKILEEERDAPTQDFLFLNMPVFFTADIRTLLDFVRQMVDFEADGLSPEEVFQKIAQTYPREVELFLKYMTTMTSPLESEYWSCVAFALGDGAVKYHVKPAISSTESSSESDTEDMLRHAMIDRLTTRQEAARFEFYVQRQEDADTMPIEDGTTLWHSLDEHVATITIPPQTFDTPEQRQFGEDLFFTAWHSLPAHRPLGGLNRARRVAYSESSKLRHQTRGVAVKEPTNEE